MTKRTPEERVERARELLDRERAQWASPVGLQLRGYKLNEVAVPRNTALRAITAALAEADAERERLRAALERISDLTSRRAAAFSADDLHATVKSIADTALSGQEPSA